MKRNLSLLLICTILLTTLSTVTAFAAYDECPFTDLVHGYYSGYFNVMSLVEKGIISGKTESTFAPSDPVTREEAAKIIVLASGAPLSNITGNFTDVVSGAWYEPYIETAHETGLMEGKGDGLFGIGEYITRQDAAVLAVRMAEYMGIDIVEVKTDAIDDIEDVSDYAVDAVSSLVNMNVADLSDNSFKPNDNITRLQFCVFIDRILISDDNLHDDYLNDWMPVEKDITEYQSEILAFEDFENGLTTLEGYNSAVAGSPNALDYIVTDSGKDSSSSLKVPAGKTVNLYLIGVEAGADYFFSYDIKTDGLEDNFARVNYEWYNSSGEIRGIHERNNDVYGDRDWITHTATTTAATPDTFPEFLRIAFSVRDVNGDGTTGSIQIDNFKIYKVVYEPLTTYLKKPAYKGVITDPDGEADIRITSYIKGLDSVYDRDAYHVVADLSDFNDRSYFNSRLDDISPEMDITFSSKSLAIGDYDLSVKFIHTATGNVVGENHWVIRKRTEDFMPKYFFDEHGRMLKNGEPYFGIGAYAIGLQASDLEDFKDTPIEFMIANSVGNYWENNSLFETMAEYGLSSIMSMESVYKDAIRGQYQNGDVTTIASERPIMERLVEDLNLTDEEGHMGYQINNESPAARWARRIAWHNQILSDIDLDHITFGVGDCAPVDYARCHDIYAVDPYPITGADTDKIWTVYEKTKALADGTANRPIWTVAQISDLKVMGYSPYTERERGPNETELRNMAWQAVCGGAQAVVWYAHFHLDKEGVSRPKSETFPEVIRVSEELDKYSDVIMSVEDAPDVRLTAEDSEKFAHLVRRYNGKTYVFLVNMSKDAQNISLYLDDATDISGAYSGENYATGEGGKLDMTLDALGVEILIVDQTEQASPDCVLNDVQFSDGKNSYFIVREDGENILYIPESINMLYYNADIHPDARIIVNGCPNEAKGRIKLEDKKEIRFTVISEDGQHHTQTRYTIVRK